MVVALLWWKMSEFNLRLALWSRFWTEPIFLAGGATALTPAALSSSSSQSASSAASIQGHRSVASSRTSMSVSPPLAGS